MTSYEFDFLGHRLEARASGALFWPERRCLIVADLHLGKSERMARRGGVLLPPYETQSTLERLRDEIEATDPVTIVSLGDGFDDDAAGRALPDNLCQALQAMAQGRRWVWIGGNHDPGAVSSRLPGLSMPEFDESIMLRHEAGQSPDISGHYHPCIQLAGQRLRCFLVGEKHLIMPAFGAYTGGLSLNDPALRNIVPTGIAVACGHRTMPVPIGLKPARRRA